MNKKYKITITESDRQKADYYINNHHCIVATAIRRTIPELTDVNVGPNDVFIRIKGQTFLFRFSEILSDKWAHSRRKLKKGQTLWYNKAVVGKSFSMTLVR